MGLEVLTVENTEITLFWDVTPCMGQLQLITRSNCSGITNSRTLPLTIAHANSSQFAMSSCTHYLVVASSNVDSLYCFCAQQLQSSLAGYSPSTHGLLAMTDHSLVITCYPWLCLIFTDCQLPVSPGFHRHAWISYRILFLKMSVIILCFSIA
jgi:hypothetical protein